MAQWDRMSTVPLLLHTAHSAPMQMVFYQGREFPADFQGDAFVALHGSWNRSTKVGYKVVRVPLTAAGAVAGPAVDFMTGFLEPGGAAGRSGGWRQRRSDRQRSGRGRRNWRGVRNRQEGRRFRCGAGADLQVDPIRLA